MRLRIIVLVLAFFPLISQGQADRWWNTYHYLGTPDIERPTLWLNGGGHFNSNRLNNALTSSIIQGAAITPIETQFLTDDPSDSRTTIGAGADGEIWLRGYGNSNTHLHVGVGFSDQVFANFSTGLAQLILNGNGPYEDQELELGPSWLRYLSHQFIGIGLDHETDALIIGGNLKLLKVSRWQSINITSGSLYTAPFGTSIDADLTGRREYTASTQAKSGSWYGTGVSADLFLVSRPDPGKLMLSVQVNDLGLLFFSGLNHQDLLLDTVFKGIEANDLLQGQTSISNGDPLADGVELLSPSSENEASNAWIPGNVQLDAVQPIGDRWSLSMQLRQYYLSIPPQLRLGMHAKLSEWLGLEPYAQVGGFTRFDAGVTASVHPGNNLHLLLKYGLLERQIAPNGSVSQHIRMNLHFLF